jgi:hypothetical protein
VPQAKMHPESKSGDEDGLDQFFLTSRHRYPLCRSKLPSVHVQSPEFP